jgi:hypothetical protein
VTRHALLVLCILVGCTDTGVVGARTPMMPPCDGGCSDAATCDACVDAATCDACVDAAACDGCADAAMCDAAVTCDECSQDDDCAIDEDGPFCDTERRNCIECRTLADCDDGDTRYCMLGQCQECLNAGECPLGQTCEDGECAFDD